MGQAKPWIPTEPTAPPFPGVAAPTSLLELWNSHLLRQPWLHFKWKQNKALNNAVGSQLTCTSTVSPRQVPARQIQPAGLTPPIGSLTILTLLPSIVLPNPPRPRGEKHQGSNFRLKTNLRLLLWLFLQGEKRCSLCVPVHMCAQVCVGCWWGEVPVNRYL